MAQDYYKTLGIERSATPKEIKSAYRKLAKKHHPDANKNDPSAENKFKELNEAHEVLSDPEKRKLYDQFGTVNPQEFGGFSGSGYQQQPGGYGYTQAGDPGNMNDILEGLFGGSRGGRTGSSTGGFSGGFGFGRATMPETGEDITQRVMITLEEAYTGTTRTIVKEGRKVRVTIPAGATDGTKVRLAGEGAPGYNGGNPGDLFLMVEVQKNPLFERNGNDLTTDVRVDAFTAMLGGEVEVATLSRPIRLKVTPGTQSGRRFRLAGKGMPLMREPEKFGDLFARVVITVPEHLTEEQHTLAERLRASLAGT